MKFEAWSLEFGTGTGTATLCKSARPARRADGTGEAEDGCSSSGASVGGLFVGIPR
jgi:hypothetical protein